MSAPYPPLSSTTMNDPITDALKSAPKRVRTGNPRKTRQEVDATAQIVMALDLRRDGHTYQEIADLCGWPNKGNAYHAINNALESCKVEHIDQYRDEELDRLNHYMTELAPHRLIGEDKVPNLDVFDSLMKLSIARRKLLGLDRQSEAGQASMPLIRSYQQGYLEGV